MWQKRLILRNRAFRKSLRNSRLHRIFGERTFHRRVWRTSRDALAGGLALGLFVAFTPTIPFQMLLAGAGALFLKVNLPIALLACWVTNPVTAFPIFMSAWNLGRAMLGPESPINELVAVFLPDTRAGRLLRTSAYLWSGALLYATVAAIVGNLLVRAIWQAVTRMLAAHHKGIRVAPPLVLAAKSLFFAALLLGGVLLQRSGLMDVSRVQALVGSGNQWWLPVAIIALMIFLFALALPAAPLIALCGVLYRPIPATLLVLLGGVSGSLVAYLLSQHLTTNALRPRRSPPKLVQQMRNGTSFSSLFALRICPGVPHAAINYTAGALHTPIHLFLLSSAAGFLAKGLVYTTAAHRATHIDPDTQIWSLTILWPLIGLLALALIGISIERHLANRRNECVPTDMETGPAPASCPDT